MKPGTRCEKGCIRYHGHDCKPYRPIKARIPLPRQRPQRIPNKKKGKVPFDRIPEDFWY